MGVKLRFLGGSGTGTGGTSFNADTLSFPGVPYSSQDMNDANCNTQSGNIENYGDKYQALIRKSFHNEKLMTSCYKRA